MHRQWCGLSSIQSSPMLHKREMPFYILIFYCSDSNRISAYNSFSIFIFEITFRKWMNWSKWILLWHQFQMSQYSKKQHVMRQQSKCCQNEYQFQVFVKCWQINYYSFEGKKPQHSKSFAKWFQKYFNEKLQLPSALGAYHRVWEIRCETLNPCTVIASKRFIYFSRRGMKNLLRWLTKKITRTFYDDCLFWFRLWLIVELFHLHLFFSFIQRREDEEKKMHKPSDAFYWNQWVIHTMLSPSSSSLPLVWYFAMFTRFNQRMNVINLFEPNEKKKKKK